MRELAEQIVDAMNAVHGIHEGFRAVHAKGVCCRGEFTATPEAAELCIAPHFQDEPVPVTVRFSSGSGKPTRADGARDERGMAVKFHLPDDRTTDMVGLTIPVFFVRTPADFLELLETQRPDPATGKPDMERIAAFAERHPETQKAFGFVMFTMSPAGFANCTFHGVHAFGYEAPDGTKRWARYRWVSAAGESTLTDEETRALGRNYLGEEMERRLVGGEVIFDLFLQLAEEDDDLTDPTNPWPEERKLARMGQLRLTEFVGTGCDPMIFDPGNLIEGIEPSEDPILQMRSPAYSVSFERRTR